MSPDHVLVLPGWQSSGPTHWQSRWESLHGYTRVQQHDWMSPLRGDWITRLEEVVMSREGSVVLVAHSLGCILTAAWATLSRNVHRVQAALLVAPGDVQRPELQAPLRSWSPIPMQPLPFASVLVASRNDPYCRFERAQDLARAWGSRLVDAGLAGHLNADSALGDWPEGHAHLQALMAA